MKDTIVFNAYRKAHQIEDDECVLWSITQLNVWFDCHVRGLNYNLLDRTATAPDGKVFLVGTQDNGTYSVLTYPILAEHEDKYEAWGVSRIDTTGN